MNLLMHMLMGLIVGYMIGIAIAALFVFGLGLEEPARFIAIGSGLLGAVLGPAVADALARRSR